LHESDESEEALAVLRQLANKIKEPLHRAVGQWHYSQTLGMVAKIFEDLGDYSKAAQYYSKAGGWDQSEALSFGQSAANRYAYSALCWFKRGKSDKAARVASLALILADRYRDKSRVFHRVEILLRQYNEKKARRRKQQ